MNTVPFAILCVLVSLQTPSAVVVSGDESLRGVSALSVSVQAQGDLIDAAATKADIEAKLRQRGVRVLDRGLPRLHLKVDSLTTTDGRSTYEVFTVRLELSQALSRPGAKGLIEGVTWSAGGFGIFGEYVGKQIESRAAALVGDFMGALLSVNAGLAKAGGAAGFIVKQRIHTIENRAYLGSFYDMPRHLEGVVVKQLQQLIDQKQQLLICSYEPSTKGVGTGFRQYEFWYNTPPAGLREMLAVAPPGTHPFGVFGLQGLETCPETPDVAVRLRGK